MQFEIIVDHGETANKCTIVPLIYRDDFTIRRTPAGGKTFELASPLLLHPDGIPLNQFTFETRPSGIAAIDCVWRRLSPILSQLVGSEPQWVSIPSDFVTAYPRRSKKDFDPDGGLATIEALFIAAAFMGHWDLTLLREYFFAEQFLALNASIFQSYHLTPPLVTAPIYQPQPRTAQSRREGRGRIPRTADMIPQ